MLTRVFEDRQAAENLARFFDDVTRRARHELDEAARAVAVDRLRATLLAQSDRAYLGQPTFDRTPEVGVRFDAIDQQHMIGLEGRRAHEHGHFIDVADLLDVHARDDWHAYAFARDAIAGQHVALAVGSGAAVAAHGRHDERIAAELADGFTAGTQDVWHVGNAAAAGGDRHAFVEGDALEDWLELGSDACRDLVNGDFGGFVRRVDALAGEQAGKLQTHLRAEVGRDNHRHTPHRSPAWTPKLCFVGQSDQQDDEVRSVSMASGTGMLMWRSS